MIKAEQPTFVPGNTRCFTELNRNRLLGTTVYRVAPKGSLLFWEGDLSDKLFYIKNGRVKLTKSTEEGKELVLYMYQAGDLIGHADLFTRTRHSFSAEVLEKSEIGVIDYKSLEELICQHGDFAIDFMKWMGVHHRITQTKFRDLMMYGKPGALSSTLIRLANTYGEVQENGWILITKKMTHTDLANMIGATRESVNRMLRDLRKQDVLDMTAGKMMIKDLSHLQHMCRCELCPVEICRI
ncbi:Crp/Fnr family transcriptional regulator [Paenibacillus lemnae]|uniref:Crp/Fnr family transcriptional regulator n=1 Tax=Paenibacillus lemnae TaxID=1330551 RepID=A0A848M791_PAELE|nr:Crp/Fnr family transcriptional regulator [Paenibacillus lemnae]NMO96847.1 Crp/Fnr family transcriptional regulator [Paenibacillus lemnae]